MGQKFTHCQLYKNLYPRTNCQQETGKKKKAKNLQQCVAGLQAS